MQGEWKELIASLTFHGVEFLVVGAHALAVHSQPRFTVDLDLFLRRSAENGERLYQALRAFGIPVTKEAIERLMAVDDQMFVVGHEPFAVDFMNFLTGVDFESAWNRRVEAKLGDVKAFFLSKDDYRATKQATGRPKDLADLALLDEATDAK